MMKQIELVEKNVKPDILIISGMKKHLSIYSILLKKYLWEKEHIDSWKPQVMRTKWWIHSQNKHFSAGLSSAAIPGSHVKNLQKEFLVL